MNPGPRGFPPLSCGPKPRILTKLDDGPTDGVSVSVPYFRFGFVFSVVTRIWLGLGVEKIQVFLRELQRPFVGREEEARLVVLTLLAREHAVLIGEPGVAKSAIVRRAADLLNARFFKYLLTRFTEPAELFGPLDIKALEDGRYVRLTRGKLPEADIAFLDEVFKANSAILNALNSILQERIVYDGYSEIRTPLWSLFGASNEVPDEPEVEAFYDRFLVRHFVRPLPEDMWGDLLDRTWELERAMYFGDFDGKPVMSIDDLRAYHERVLNVRFDAVKQKLVKVFAVLESRGIHLSDRRKGKALKLIAANAVLEGRDEVIEKDLLVLKYVAAKDWDELEKVNAVLADELKTPYKYLRELEEIKINVRETKNYVISLEHIESRYIDLRFKQMLRDLEITKDRVIAMMLESGDPNVERAANEVIELIEETAERIRRRLRGE